MNPSRLFILRPVATSLLMGALLLLGIAAYRMLPVSALPQIDYPIIEVTTLYPGASPDVVTSTITAPLERQFGQLPGLTQLFSSSSGGASLITLKFNLGFDLDVAEQEVQAAINAATNFLPPDLPMPPLYSKVNPADAPILILAVSAKHLTLAKVEELVDTRLAQKLAQLPGVGQVSISGGQKPAIRIQANPTALAAYHLSLEDLRLAIANANVNLPKGMFSGPTRASAIDANDQLISATEYAKLIVAYRNGRAIYLADVADAKADVENARLAAWANASSAIIVNIRRQPGSNVIEVAENIRTRLSQLEYIFPDAVDIQILADRTVPVRASIAAVQHELLYAVVLVVLVIFLFLRRASATAIPAITVPLSLIGTFAIMYLAGFSINNLTLMALTIASGFVVDDAIVVIENIARRIEQGENPLTAALKGSEQIGFTILSLTLSLVAVLIPLLFLEDVIGRLFREFAITLAYAILLSAVISLTLTPMMCARLLRPAAVSETDPCEQKSRAFFPKILDAYSYLLTRALDHRGIVLASAIATLALTVFLYWYVAKGFFPVQDTGLIQGQSEAPQTISFAAMSERQQTLIKALLDDPAVANVSSFIGVDGHNSTLNNGRLTIALKPLAERKAGVMEVIQRLQSRVEREPGIRLYLRPVQDLTLETQDNRAQYQITLEGTEQSEINAWAGRFVEELAHDPALTNVASDVQDEGLQAFLTIDRTTASRRGLTVADIGNTLYNAFGQRLVSTIFTQSNQRRIVLEVKPVYRNGVGALKSLYVGKANGPQVPLSAVASVEERKTPLIINHIGQFPAVTVSFNTAPGESLGEAFDSLKHAATKIGLPGHIRIGYQGAIAAFDNSLTHTLGLLLASIITVYIVLGVLYESYWHPVTILSTLPSAAVGALLALILSGSDLNIIAIIGIILLIGIVKKNAIMMIDFALTAQRQDNLAARDAIYQACLLRFRPILMTTMAALFSAVPLWLGTGVGSELRHPLGLTMIGGLVVSQLLTLFTTPVIYLAFDNLSRRHEENRPEDRSRRTRTRLSP